jgi:hypothetical protein
MLHTVTVFGKKIYKFFSLFNRERKSFLHFHWNGVTILAIPENSLLFYVTHFEVLAGISVSRVRSVRYIACMGEMRNTYRFLVSKQRDHFAELYICSGR